MIEEIVLPVYGWQVVPSVMHSVESLLDGRRIEPDVFRAVTLKSGPRCLNDEMAQNIGRDVAKHVGVWANSHSAHSVDFTYGVLYGTKAQSNKKDWHVLRSIAESLPDTATVSSSHRAAWSIAYKRDNISITASVRIGIDWWDYLGGPNTWLEVCLALIRACVEVAPQRLTPAHYTIVDLPQILDMSSMPENFNIALLQESQIEWVLFLARHFCDGLVP